MRCGAGTSTADTDERDPADGPAGPHSKPRTEPETGRTFWVFRESPFPLTGTQRVKDSSILALLGESLSRGGARVKGFFFTL